MTNIDEIDLSRVYKSNDHFKPRGLWYAENHEWLRWCHSEMPHWIKPNLFELDLDMSKILVIANERALNLFNHAFKRSVSGFDMIDWKAVKKQYKGIEIRNYYNIKNNCDFHGYSMWFYGWDVPGGCVWDFFIQRRFVIPLFLSNGASLLLRD